ncbi:MAG: hypothetical protein JST01_24550 [Cyanobacteria bacterium SZAS TMP-1]|nr:hypothetical protein [Cyanobacteria bacterium SZAS TMP-1]
MITDLLYLDETACEGIFMIERKTVRDVIPLDVHGRATDTVVPAGFLVRLEPMAQFVENYPNQPGHTLCHVYLEGALRWLPDDAIAAGA